MMRRMLVTGCLVALAAGAAFAGDMHKETQAGQAGADVKAMQAEMMKCDVCKHMAPHLPSLAPSMTMDYAVLNDGVAMMHGVTDPAKLDEYRAISAEMGQAGEACLMLSDKDAETHLCKMCQGIRHAMNAGAHMSMGDTRMGDVMVLTSDDPAVQKELQGLATMCEMMMASM